MGSPSGPLTSNFSGPQTSSSSGLPVRSPLCPLMSSSGADEFLWSSDYLSGPPMYPSGPPMYPFGPLMSIPSFLKAIRKWKNR